jgi:hypothetical protein
MRWVQSNLPLFYTIALDLSFKMNPKTCGLCEIFIFTSVEIIESMYICSTFDRIEPQKHILGPSSGAIISKIHDQFYLPVLIIDSST